MKKINNYILVAALVATSFTFGCKKSTTDSVVPANGSATISGIVKYSFDKTNDTSSVGVKTESVPTGTVITAQINTGDLVLGQPGGYPNKQYRTTIAADGSYSFTVDANTETVNVTITIEDFRANRTDFKVPGPGSVTSSQVYSAQTYNNAVQVVNGESKIYDIDNTSL